MVHTETMEDSSYHPFITPSSTCLSEDLLFFDTFSHSSSDKDNFDLVQFPSPVVIDLIKIIPLGQPIEAKIPGNVRLGATNPSKCELEFFINDLTKQDAHTMTDLGKFYCSEKDTDFNPPIQVQTDGLLLRGSYRTLTLAIFGRIVAYDEKIDDDQVILSATSPPAQTPASPVEEQTDRDMPYLVDDRELLRVAREESESIDEESILMKLGETNKNDDTSHTDNNYVNDHGIGPTTDIDVKDHANLDDLSSSDVGPAADCLDERKIEHNDYSNFSGEVDMQNFSHRLRDSSKHETSIEPANELSDRGRFRRDDQEGDVREWSFNVDTYEPKPLVYFPDPSLTLQERALSSHRSSNRRESVGREVEKVMEMFDGLCCHDNYRTDDWVTLIEDLTNDIANMSLSQTVNHDLMLRFLVKQVLDGLDMNLALKQKQTGFKVRHVRAGLKLATLLFHCGNKAVTALLDSGVPQKVLQLYNKEHMSFPLKLLMFKCLSAACDSVEGVEHFINHTYTWDDETDLKLAKIKKNLSTTSIKASETSTSSLVKFEKPDIDEIDSHVEGENSPQQSKLESTDIHRASDETGNEYTCYRYMILILLTRQTTRVTMAVGNLIKKIRLHHNLARLSAINLSKTDDDSEDSVFDSENSSQISENMEQSVQLIQDIIELMKDNCANIAQPVRYLPANVQFHVKPSPNDNFLAIYRCIKHYNILECINTILVFINSNESRSIAQLELSVRLQDACILFIQSILDSPRGTQLFMSPDCYDSTGKLIKTMATRHTPKRTAHLRLSDCIDTLPSASLCREEFLAAAYSRDTSLRLAYCFKIFSCIDKLFDYHRELISKRVNTSNCDPEKVLHQLFLMSEHPYGLAAIMKHFACIGNLDCILRFLDVSDHHKHLEFVKETSIDYALQLIGTFLRLNNNVLEIADEYLDTIIELSKTKDKNFSAKIKSLIPWLTPFDVEPPTTVINYSEETFRQLTRVIRKSIPDRSIPFAQGLNFELPPKLITAVRIMRQLCIPPQVESFITTNFDVYSTHRVTANSTKPPTYMPFYDSHQNYSNMNIQVSRNNTMSNLFDESMADQINQISNTYKLFQPYDESICGDLKFHYGIMQVFEQEGLKRLLNTLRELTSNYPRPAYQSAALNGFRGRIVISFIHSVVVLLHSLTCHLIDARGKEFKDASIIPVILESYSLLCFVPKPSMKRLKELSKRDDLSSLQKSVSLKSDNYQLAQQTKKLILSILMSYTQLCLSASESEENVISKSMWTKMLKEVIEFTMSAPVFFHHGLDVLTKILPSPLPSPSVMDSIDQEQLFKNINHRKLWSAHLHPLHQRLEQMISSLSICYPSNVRALLFYLCNQLCDLSSSTACMVGKTITDSLITLVSKLNQSEQSTGSNNTSTPEHQTNSHQKQQAQQQQQSQQEDHRGLSVSRTILCGQKESLFAVKVLINLMSHLITNQAFKTAVTNHLQVIGKKDERILSSLQSVLKVHEDYKASTSGVTGSGVDNTDDTMSGMSGIAGNSYSLVNVAQVVESIKLIGESASSMTVRNGHGGVGGGGGVGGVGASGAHQGANQVHGSSLIEAAPPEELTRINLLDLAHKTSDRFDLVTSLTKSYRLKVLLDMNSRAHRSSESASTSAKRFDHAPPYNYRELLVQSSYKSYVAPLRGRGRSIARPDSFRSRPQNTSRPPSIHVDDFVDIYGEHSGRSASKASLSSGSGLSGQQSMSSDYHHSRLSVGGGSLLPGSSMLGPPPQPMLGSSQQQVPGPNSADAPSLLHRPIYFSPPQPPPPSGLPSYGGNGGGSRSHSKSKHMKMK